MYMLVHVGSSDHNVGTVPNGTALHPKLRALHTECVSTKSRIENLGLHSVSMCANELSVCFSVVQCCDDNCMPIGLCLQLSG